MSQVTPKLKALLKEWNAVKLAMEPIKEQLKPLADRESALRRELATHFTDVVEGSKNSIQLAGGYSLKLTHKVKREVDETAFKSLSEDFKKEGLPIDLLFRSKHELEKAVYTKLPAEQKEKIDSLLVVKNESPTIELVAPKESK